MEAEIWDWMLHIPSGKKGRLMKITERKGKRLFQVRHTKPALASMPPPGFEILRGPETDFERLGPTRRL
jgi:hypothetical protein